MRRPYAIYFALIPLTALMLLSTNQVWGAERGPSTPEERKKALEMVELLETSPSSPEAKDATKWLTVWLIEVPDITVKFCLAPLGSAKEREGIPAGLVVQQAFSQAAFLIRNPEAEAGSSEVYVAGVEGALKSYQAMRSASMVEALPAFEKLKMRKAKGDLERVVRKRAKKCK